MADAQDSDYTAHLGTYTAFSKLVLFSILFIVLLLSCMALGLVGGAPLFALLMGIGGTIALLVAFAVLS
ncbi:MAG: aa3-type cytochrome c oxidase subunit IV [Reyranella sp.]|nr:aa3-type cytochrome c oxidase subunit IV [Reyranella sp.]